MLHRSWVSVQIHLLNLTFFKYYLAIAQHVVWLSQLYQVTYEVAVKGVFAVPLKESFLRKRTLKYQYSCGQPGWACLHLFGKFESCLSTCLSVGFCHNYRKDRFSSTLLKLDITWEPLERWLFSLNNQCKKSNLTCRLL